MRNETSENNEPRVSRAVAEVGVRRRVPANRHQFMKTRAQSFEDSIEQEMNKSHYEEKNEPDVQTAPI